MAKQETFKQTAKRVQEAMGKTTHATRHQHVRSLMDQVQRENEENFLKQFRENDFRELVALMGCEVETDEGIRQ